MLFGAVALTLILQISIPAQVNTNAPVLNQTIAVNTNPLSLVLGSYGGNVEVLLNGKHGLMAEAGFSNSATASATVASFHYRHHYFTKPRHQNMNSPFWGPFFYYEKSHGTIADNANNINYTVDILYGKLGLDWGRRWVWNNGFNICFHIGYGLPLIADFDWHGNEPDQVDVIENLTKLIAGIDGGLSLGFAF
jgi:hypothetical protein